MTETELITADNPIASTEAPQTFDTTTENGPAESAGGQSGRGSLSTMVLPELRALATEVGVKGISGMRKGDLIAAIREQQNGGGRAKAANDAAPAGAPAAQEASAPAASEAAPTSGDSERKSEQKDGENKGTENKGAEQNEGRKRATHLRYLGSIITLHSTR